MFIGEYQHNIDQKGRIAVPAKFRPQLGSGVVVTRGLDHCLFIYTETEWQELAQKLVALPLTQANSRAFVRLMLAGAMQVSLDSQGRILLPDYLREYAGLNKEAVIAGLFNRVEIWDRQKWQEYKARTEAESDEIAEKLTDLDI
jgi:MraZ protein